MRKIVLISLTAALAACKSEAPPAQAESELVVDTTAEGLQKDIAANNVDAKTTKGEPVTLASLQAAFEKGCGDTKVQNAICKPTDNPTEFACDYALQGENVFDMKHTVIAEDGDSFKFVEAPEHCASE